MQMYVLHMQHTHQVKIHAAESFWLFFLHGHDPSRWAIIAAFEAKKYQAYHVCELLKVMNDVQQ